MRHVSSSMTLLIKLVIPVVWITFFATLLLGALLTKKETVGSFSIGTFRIIASVFFVLGVALLYYTLMRLKRVDMDPDFFYVSNYFKTYRYSYQNIERIAESDYGPFRLIHFYLKKPGKFGNKITMLASRYRFDHFVREHPSLFADAPDLARS